MKDRAREALQAALPAYEFEGELGRGAFGVVYAARHTQLGRGVAIKVLPEVFAVDDTVRRRFVAEAQMVASLEHPHIVPVYDYVEGNDACMLIMERCAASVGDRFKAHGIATDEACAAVLACLAALDLAHSQGVLHRDIKPENLMIDTKGVVKLADFGIARALDSEVRHTKTGMVVGTPAYMSPEQVRGDELTGASDVYSVAMMTYELLAGTLPFPNTPSVTGLLAHHLATEPLPLRSTRPELPRAVCTVVDRALSKSLEQRHDTAFEFATDLSGACVRSFGSGWLRRRGFTLQWPDMVAENERPSTEHKSTATGTITVQAMSEPHEVISPEEALTAWNDTLLGRNALSDSETPTVPATPPSGPPAGPIPAGPPPPSGASPTHSTPAAETRDVAATTASKRNMVIIAACGLLALLAAAAVVFALLDADDDDPDAASPASSVETEPDAADGDTATATTQAPVVDAPTTAPSTAATPTSDVADPPAEQPADTTLPDPGEVPSRPPSYVPTDATSPLAPTPCPEGQPKVACIHTGVETDPETDVVSVSFFTEGFVPELEPASDHVHFYFDTTVDGNEAAAGSGTAIADFKPWDQPFDISQTQGDNGRTMFTVTEARAADARYLCIIVADAEQVAIPGTGNCAPFLQTWDRETLASQEQRIRGTFIGRCAIGVTAIVPADWRSADLVATTPADAASGLFPQDPNAEGTFQGIVANGGVLYADGPVGNGVPADLIASTYPGDFRIGSNPQQVSREITALGIDVGATANDFIGGRSVLTSTTELFDVVSKRYFLPDFGYMIELVVNLDPGVDIADADAIADTVVGC